MYVLSDLENAVEERVITRAYIDSLCNRWRERSDSHFLWVSALSFIHGSRMLNEHKGIESDLAFLVDLMR